MPGIETDINNGIAKKNSNTSCQKSSGDHFPKKFLLIGFRLSFAVTWSKVEGRGDDFRRTKRQADITPRRHFHTNAPITPSCTPSAFPFAPMLPISPPSSPLSAPSPRPLRGAPESMNSNMIMRTSAGESSRGRRRLIGFSRWWKGGYTGCFPMWCFLSSVDSWPDLGMGRVSLFVFRNMKSMKL